MSDSQTLRQWLDASGTPDVEFARKLGISASHLSLIASGQRGASLELALKIEAVTDGAVPPRSLGRVQVSSGAAECSA